ncbi:LPXTG cell wall anchor domain-containing protein [Mammaliicoccus sciuri]
MQQVLQLQIKLIQVSTRNADGSTNMKLVNPSTSSSGDAMTYALIFSGAVLLLAGSFFLGKKRASK